MTQNASRIAFADTADDALAVEINVGQAKFTYQPGSWIVVQAGRQLVYLDHREAGALATWLNARLAESPA